MEAISPTIKFTSDTRRWTYIFSRRSIYLVEELDLWLRPGNHPRVRSSRVVIFAPVPTNWVEPLTTPPRKESDQLGVVRLTVAVWSDKNRFIGP